MPIGCNSFVLFFINIFLLRRICLHCFHTVAWWQEGHPACTKTEWWGAGMVLSGVRCRLAYSPADATVSYFSKIQIDFTFVNTKSCCLSIVLTATGQKMLKSLKS